MRLAGAERVALALSRGRLGGPRDRRRGGRRPVDRADRRRPWPRPSPGFAVVVPRREVGGARDRRGAAPGARHDDRGLPAGAAPARLPARRARGRRRHRRGGRRGARPRVAAALVRELTVAPGGGPAARGARAALPRHRAAGDPGAGRDGGAPACASTSTAWARSPRRVRDRADELRDQIWELAGGEFVIDSPKQLGQVLFERLGLPTFRKGKTGWSTDRKVLQLLEDKHPIVRLIGQYRELTKLDNTYLSALPDLVGEDGRLHTTFNQTVAETGRLSSTNPNLQNIPMRTPLGREIRGAFVAEAGLAAGELRLQPGGAAHPGPLLGRAGAGRRLPPRRGRAPRHRRRGLRHGAGRRRPRPPATAPRPSTSGSSTASATSACPSSSTSRAPTRGPTSTPTSPATRGCAASSTPPSPPRRRTATSPRCSAGAGPSPSWAGRTVQQRQLGERLAVNTVIQGTRRRHHQGGDGARPRGAGRGRACGRGSSSRSTTSCCSRRRRRRSPARRRVVRQAMVVGLPARPAAGGGRGRGGDVAGRQVVSGPEDAYRVLQVDPAACPRGDRRGLRRAAGDVPARRRRRRAAPAGRADPRAPHRHRTAPSEPHGG